MKTNFYSILLPDREQLLFFLPQADKVAQMVVKQLLERFIEPNFHQDSYGYRPGKSVIGAVDVAQQRWWRYKWFLCRGSKGFFDNCRWRFHLKYVSVDSNL